MCVLEFHFSLLTLPLTGKFLNFAAVLDWAQRFGFFHFRFKTTTMDQRCRNRMDCLAWLAAHERLARRSLGDPLALAHRYSDLINPQLQSPSQYGYSDKLPYFGNKGLPLFLSHIIAGR